MCIRDSNDAETLYNGARSNRAGAARFNKWSNGEAIKDAKRKGYIVIVNGHAGKEGTTRSNSFQREHYRYYIDSGADLIISHHPHVSQEIESYKGKKIFYSLGNFVFETGDRENYKNGLAVEVIIDIEKGAISEMNKIDVRIERSVPSFKSSV